MFPTNFLQLQKAVYEREVISLRAERESAVQKYKELQLELKVCENISQTHKLAPVSNHFISLSFKRFFFFWRWSFFFFFLQEANARHDAFLVEFHQLRQISDNTIAEQRADLKMKAKKQITDMFEKQQQNNNLLFFPPLLSGIWNRTLGGFARTIQATKQGTSGRVRAFAQEARG